jgi:copper chaperone CopZ
MMAEKKVAKFTVEPKMSCSSCENKIKSNLRFEKGIIDVEPSAKNQIVTIEYDTEKTTVAKIEAAFKKIGYVATESTATTTDAKASGCCGNLVNGKCCGKNKAKTNTTTTKTNK